MDIKTDGFPIPQGVKFPVYCRDPLFINYFLILSQCMRVPSRWKLKGHRPRHSPSVTDQMLANPSPYDWLMFSRTYDAQRYSPLKQNITKGNIGQRNLRPFH